NARVGSAAVGQGHGALDDALLLHPHRSAEGGGSEQVRPPRLRDLAALIPRSPRRHARRGRALAAHEHADAPLGGRARRHAPAGAAATYRAVEAHTLMLREPTSPAVAQ